MVTWKEVLLLFAGTPLRIQLLFQERLKEILLGNENSQIIGLKKAVIQIRREVGAFQVFQAVELDIWFF